MPADNPIRTLIGQWPSREAFAEAVGTSVARVHKWASNGRIPSGFQKAVCEAAEQSGVDYVTPDWMLNVHALEDEKGAT